MKLYYGRGACSLAAHLSLYEAGATFEAERVDLKTKKTESGADYLAINPHGFVPALVTDSGATLTEAIAVLLYIGDLFPNSRLTLPATSFERYRLIEALSFISSELHRSYSPFFRDTTPDAYKEVLQQKLQTRLAFVDGKLAQQPFWFGATFTVADAYLFVVLRWSEAVKIDITPFKNLQRFREVVGGRASVQAALKAEGLLK